MDFHPEHKPRRAVADAHRAIEDGEQAAPPEEEAGLLATELRHHLPWTVAGVVVALVVVWSGLALISNFPTDQLFHIMHPTHLLLSAAATSAMATVHGASRWRATVIGVIGSAGVCTLSDIVLPYLGAVVLAEGAHLHLHLCIAEHPTLGVAAFVALGIGVGLLGARMVQRSTIYGHAGHVLVSALASLLFLIHSGAALTTGTLGPILLLLVAAVMIPCCLSDIVVPVLFGGPRCRHSH